MKRDNRIWAIDYTDQGKGKRVSNLTKAEAKRIWGTLMDTFGRNAIMSGECSEAYLIRDYKTVAMKNGDAWFIKGELINGLYDTKEEILALI